MGTWEPQPLLLSYLPAALTHASVEGIHAIAAPGCPDVAHFVYGVVARKDVDVSIH